MFQKRNRHSKVPDFIEFENNFRNGRYKKNNEDEMLFQKVNESLKEIEENEFVATSPRPTIFIFGLPRSGSTLLSQLVAKNLQLGFVNSIIAKFWQAPLVGISLSKFLQRSEPDNNYVSDRGKSESIWGPHEFAYFWHYWLKKKELKDFTRFDHITPKEGISWGKLALKVLQMQERFDSGMVFKTAYAANHIRKFNKHFAFPFFIYIERDQIDVGLSILKSRISYYNDKEKWWSTFPPNYDDLKDLSFDQQIAGQVNGLSKTYNECMSLIGDKNILKISYHELCHDPNAIIHEIQKRIKYLYNYNINITSKPPMKFHFRKHDNMNLNTDQKKVRKSIMEYYNL